MGKLEDCEVGVCCECGDPVHGTHVPAGPVLMCLLCYSMRKEATENAREGNQGSEVHGD